LLMKKGGFLFPFLIGRIRTGICYSQFLPLHQFPFLIGRIRTNERK